MALSLVKHYWELNSLLIDIVSWHILCFNLLSIIDSSWKLICKIHSFFAVHYMEIVCWKHQSSSHMSSWQLMKWFHYLMQIIMICKNLNCMFHFFKIMSSVTNTLDYNKQLFIISFIVSFCKYHLSWIICNWSSIVVFLH